MEHPQAALARAQAGDKDAVAELYHAYAGPLLAYLITQVRRREDAEDLLGEVFVSAIRDLDRFEGTIGGVPAWVFPIRSNPAGGLAPLDAPPPDGPPPAAVHVP